jgi:hypothetical protein
MLLGGHLDGKCGVGRNFIQHRRTQLAYLNGKKRYISLSEDQYNLWHMDTLKERLLIHESVSKHIHSGI